MTALVNETTILEQMREAARNGYPEPLIRKGLGLRQGIGTTPEGPEIARLLHQGAFGGNPAAMFALGVCYELGIGVGVDAYRAVVLYRAAERERKALLRIAKRAEEAVPA